MGGRRKALNRMKPSCSEERETTQEARCSRDLRFEQLLREPQESHTRDWSSRDPGRDSTQLDEKEQNWLLQQAHPGEPCSSFHAGGGLGTSWPSPVLARKG